MPEGGVDGADITPSSVQTDQLDYKDNFPTNPGHHDGVTFKKTNGDYVSYARGQHLYTGSEADRAIMEVQNALRNIDGSSAGLPDRTGFSSKTGGLHLVGPGSYTISTAITQRSGCPMKGVGMPGGPSTDFTQLVSDGSVSEVVNLNPTDNPWGGSGGYEDTIFEGFWVKGNNTSDTADLVIDEGGGQDKILRMLELSASKGQALKLTGSANVVVEDVRVDNVGDAAETSSTVQIESAARITNLQVKNGLSSPPANQILFGGRATAKMINFSGSVSATEALLKLVDNSSVRGVNVSSNSDVSEAVRVSGNSLAENVRVETGTVEVGIRTQGQGVLINPHVKGVGQHGIVMEDESTAYSPFVGNPSQDSNDTYDCIKTGGRAGGGLYAPYLNGGGSARYGLNLTQSNFSVFRINEVKNVNSNLINMLPNGADSDVSIFDTGITAGGTAITPSDINIGNGSRPRWNGVIGGGPLGGVDLGSVNGQFDGDVAISDGTNASASAGDMGRWDAGNTQWNVFNADATI